MRFSPSTMGWYPEHTEYPSLPSDIVYVPEDVYLALFDKQIDAGPDGMPRELVPSPPTRDALVAGVTSALQAELDAEAQAFGYDDIKTAITYRGDPNPKFAAEAEAFFVKRSQTWTNAYVYLDRVEAGEVPMPTAQEAVAMMPALVLPV